MNNGNRLGSSQPPVPPMAGYVSSTAPCNPCSAHGDEGFPPDLAMGDVEVASSIIPPVQHLPDGASLGDRPSSHFRNDIPAPVPSHNRPPNAWRPPTVRPLILKESIQDFSSDGLTVQMSSTIYEANLHRLEGAIVGKILGKQIPFGIINGELRRRWLRFGSFKLSLASPDCFVCIFASREIRDNVLLSGPCFISGQVVALDQWTKEFNPSSLNGFSSPAWIRLPNFPLHLWDDTHLARIGGVLGTPLWIDGFTSAWDRSEYARICVRMDFSRKLPTGVWIQDGDRRFFQPIMYEGIAQICFNCGKAGHRDTSCPTPPPPPPTPPTHPAGHSPPSSPPPSAQPIPNGLSKPDPPPTTSSIPSSSSPLPPSTLSVLSTSPPDLKPSEDRGYGPWILVSRKKKFPPKAPTPSSRANPAASTSSAPSSSRTLAPPQSWRKFQHSLRSTVGSIGNGILPLKSPVPGLLGFPPKLLPPQQIYREVPSKPQSEPLVFSASPKPDGPSLFTHGPMAKPSLAKEGAFIGTGKEVVIHAPFPFAQRKRKKILDIDFGGGDASPSVEE